MSVCRPGHALEPAAAARRSCSARHRHSSAGRHDRAAAALPRGPEPAARLGGELCQASAAPHARRQSSFRCRLSYSLCARMCCWRALKGVLAVVTWKPNTEGSPSMSPTCAVDWYAHCWAGEAGRGDGAPVLHRPQQPQNDVGAPALARAQRAQRAQQRAGHAGGAGNGAVGMAGRTA